MPKEAKIFMVDDSRGFRDTLAMFLRKEGHEVFAQAGSLEEALEMIIQLATTDVDVALVDGNLSAYSRGGRDGALVAKKFREKFPGKPLLAISADKQPWSDIPSLTKSNSSRLIAKRVTEL